MWNDIVIGLIVGIVQGMFLRPLYKKITDYFLLLILKATKKPNLSIALANIITTIPVGLFFVSILIFKPAIIFWDNFLIFWMLGFCLGVFVYLVFFRKNKKTRIIDRIE